MQRTICLFTAMLLTAPGVQWVYADEDPVEVSGETVSPQQKLSADPNDAQALGDLMSDTLKSVVGLIGEKNFDEAQQKLNEAKEFLADLKPTEGEAKSVVLRFKSYLRTYESRIELARTSIEDLKTELEKNVDNQSAFKNVADKFASELGSIARSDPEEAQKQLKAAKDYFAKLISENAGNEALGTAVENANRQLDRYQRSIDGALKHLALIGTDAPPMEGAIHAWVNGDAMTEPALQNKVVLLDFWAVWCGPCIATFPHLREWNERYGPDGLEIVGVTSYYNYKWDAEAERAKRAEKDGPAVTPEEEQEMLKHFAEHHKLEHAFAIQTDERELSKHFLVTGIPTAALIDRKGKIRMIRVGSGESNARDIEEMIQQLLE